MFRKAIYLFGMTILSLFLSIQISNFVRAENVNDQAGFSPNHIFEEGSFGENIDILNGNLSLMIPIGQRYKVNSKLGYQLTLFYNSKVWENLWNDQPGKLIGKSPYGLGFKLHFGRIYHYKWSETIEEKDNVYRFETPDGSTHYFDINEGITIDNTHYKIEKSDTPDEFYVYYNDGTKLTLGHYVDSTDLSKCGWWTTRIESPEKDVSGNPYNYIDISYLSGDNSNRISQILDSTGRKIEFAYSGSGNSTIEIKLPSFANSESYDQDSYTTYKLQLISKTIKDPCYDHWACNQHTVTTKVLSYIDFVKDGTENYKYRISFDYIDMDMGQLWKRTLPYELGETPVEIEYTWATYILGDFGCDNGCTRHTEVYEKILNYNGQDYTWFINRFRENNTERPPQQGVGLSRSNPSSVYLWDPYGNLTMFIFEYSSIPNHCWDLCGLGSACPRYWDEGLNTAIWYFQGDKSEQDNIVRKVEYEYVVDGLDEGDDGTADYFYYGECPNRPEAYRVGRNVRLKKEKVIYYDDEKGPNNHDSHTIEYRNWDGYGHYREALEYKNSTLYRIAKTNYNPNGPITADSNWIINTYDYKQILNASGNEVSRSDYEFAVSGNDIGKLKKRIERYSPSNSQPPGNLTENTGDVIHIFSYDQTSGNLTNETTRDKDSTIVYSVDRTYAAGGYLETQEFTNIGWKSLDRDIDFNTGLVLKSRDPASGVSDEISSSYEYDSLGRPTKFTPSNTELPIFIAYPSLRETEITQGSGDNYIYVKYIYDELFRLKEIQKRNYDSHISIQKTEYDVLGNVSKTSEWADENATTFYYTEYFYTPFDDVESFPDPFYRIKTVVPPDADLNGDGTIDKYTEYDYKGVTEVKTIKGIEGIGGLLDSSTKYVYDVFSRLIEVDSPEGAVDSYYTFDENDNLINVEMGNQLRTFIYDPLNRLTMESNPENGIIHYESYDPMKNILKKIDAKQQTFIYTYDAAGRLKKVKISANQQEKILSEYDYDDTSNLNPGLGRPTQLKSYDDNENLFLTENLSYKGLNGRLSKKTFIFSDWDAGEELNMSYSYNNLGLPEVFSYPRIQDSSRTNTELAYSYQNGFLVDVYDPNRHYNYIRNIKYNEAGGVQELFYHNEVKTIIEPDVRFRPFRIKVNKNEWVENDPIIPILGCKWGHDLKYCDERSGSGQEITLWDSGAYGYDGAGNISNIGANNDFYYDRISRLIHADIYVNINNEFSLDYFYDEYGNLDQRYKLWNDDPTNQIFTIDSSTNRITNYEVSGNTYDYEYDENGNITLDEKFAYTYDSRNTLIEISTIQGDFVSKYYYDSNGYRIKSEDENIITYFIRDDSGKVLTEYKKSKEDSSGDPVWNKDYVYAVGLNIALVKNSTPAAPEDLYVDGVDAYGLTLHWEKVPENDIAGYKVFREYMHNSIPSCSHSAYDFVNSQYNDYQDSFPTGQCAPVQETVIKYWIQSYDEAQNYSEDSEVITVKPLDTTAPAVPDYAQITTVPGDRRVTISWQANQEEDIFGYNVWRADLTTPVNEDEVIKSTSFIDTGLTNGQEYCYSISAVDTRGDESEKSNPEKCETPEDTVDPSKPLNLEAYSGPSANEITLTWTPNNDGDLFRYHIYRSTVSGNYNWQNPLAYVEKTESLYEDESIPNIQAYFYVIKAVDDDWNESDPSDEVSAIPRHPNITKPTGFHGEYVVNQNGSVLVIPTCAPDYIDPACDPNIAENDTIEVHLGWDTVDGASYNIYRKEAGDKVYEKIDSTTDTNYTDTQIERDSYYYAVSTCKDLDSDGTVDESANSTCPDDSETECLVEDEFTFEDRPIDIMLYTDECDYGCNSSKCTAIWAYWNKVSEKRLLGYNVYRKCGPSIILSENTCQDSSWQKINSSPVQTNFYKDKDPGDRYKYNKYRYMVTAVRNDGEESGCSPSANLMFGDYCPDMECPDDDHCYDGRFCPTEDLCPQLWGGESPEGTPAPPQNVTASIWDDGYDCGHIDIKWSRNKESDIDSYNLYRSETSGSSYEKINSFPVAKFAKEFRNYVCDPELSSLCDTLNYYYVLTAVDRDGNESDYSNEADTCNPTPQPVPPEKVQAVPGECHAEIDLSWDCAYADGYKIHRTDAPGGQYAEIATNEGNNNTSYTDTALSEGYPYYYVIKSYIGAVESDPSEEVSSYPSDAIEPPENLEIDNDYAVNCTIHLNWDDHPDHGTILGYNVYRKIGSSGQYTKRNTGGYVANSEYTDGNLVGNEMHYYVVTAVAADETESCHSNEVSQFVSDFICELHDNPLYLDQDICLASNYMPVQLDTRNNSLKAKRKYTKNDDEVPGNPLSSKTLIAIKTEQKSLSHMIAKANYQKRLNRFAANEAFYPIKTIAKNIINEKTIAKTLDTTQFNHSIKKIEIQSNFLLSPYEKIGQSPDPLVEVYFLHTDHLGTVRYITDEIGDYSSHHEYFPFGEARVSMMSHNTHQFTGHERDIAIGSDYMLARHYRPTLARFLIQDPLTKVAPLSYTQSWNKYIYTRNNPIKYWDPNGLEESLGPIDQKDNLLDTIQNALEALFGPIIDFLGKLLKIGPAAESIVDAAVDMLLKDAAEKCSQNASDKNPHCKRIKELVKIKQMDNFMEKKKALLKLLAEDEYADDLVTSRLGRDLLGDWTEDQEARPDKVCPVDPHKQHYPLNRAINPFSN